MKQELVDFKDVISSLQLLSKKVVPLPQRKSKLKSKLLVEPVCSYKNMQVSLVCTYWPHGRTEHGKITENYLADSFSVMVHRLIIARSVRHEWKLNTFPSSSAFKVCKSFITLLCVNLIFWKVVKTFWWLLNLHVQWMNISGMWGWTCVENVNTRHLVWYALIVFSEYCQQRWRVSSVG